MSPIQWIGMLLIGLIAGVMAGMFGLGGGTIIQPAMLFLAGFSIRTAIGTSLAALLLPFGILGVLEYYRAGNVNIPAAIVLAAGLFIGCYFGARATLVMPELFVKRGFGVFLLLLSVRYLTMK